MFYYLLNNSTIIKNQVKIHKQVSTLIYGSLIYIIIHATLSCKKDSALFSNLSKYFWIVFILDCIALSFTYIMTNNGNLIFSKKIDFDASNSKKEGINNLNNMIDKINTNIKTKNKVNRIPDSKIPDSKIPDSKISDSKLNDSKITDSKIPNNRITDSKIPDTKFLDNSVKNKKQVNLTDEVLNKTNELMGENFNFPKNSDDESINDSELGSDLDLDSVEKSLKMDFNQPATL